LFGYLYFLPEMELLARPFTAAGYMDTVAARREAMAAN
jgi:hypothetical protein